MTDIRVKSYESLKNDPYLVIECENTNHIKVKRHTHLMSTGYLYCMVDILGTITSIHNKTPIPVYRRIDEPPFYMINTERFDNRAFYDTMIEEIL